MNSFDTTIFMIQNNKNLILTNVFAHSKINFLSFVLGNMLRIETNNLLIDNYQ